MEPNDFASHIETLDRDSSIDSIRRKAKGVLTFTGKCQNERCEAPIPVAELKRFCDEYCRDEHDRLLVIKKKQGRA